MSDYDRLLTTDPHDAEACEEHRRYLPCPVCIREAVEDRADREREEGKHDNSNIARHQR